MNKSVWQKLAHPYWEIDEEKSNSIVEEYLEKTNLEILHAVTCFLYAAKHSRLYTNWLHGAGISSSLQVKADGKTYNVSLSIAEAVAE